MQYIHCLDLLTDTTLSKTAKIFQHGNSQAVRLPKEFRISASTVSELHYGVAKSAKHRENAAALEEFLSRFELLDYPVDAAEPYGRVRTELEGAGKPIGNNDLLIAAHALAIGARVATANRGEFERVPGLKALDWLS